MNKTKEIFSDQYLQKAAVSNQLLTQEYKINSLPQDPQNLLKEIQTHYSALQVHNKTLTPDQKFTIETVYDKRIPEVLQKFFNIDKEYRTTLTNSEGKNAQDLMNESLTNFGQKLLSVLEEVNQDKIMDLSVTKRYSRNI